MTLQTVLDSFQVYGPDSVWIVPEELELSIASAEQRMQIRGAIEFLYNNSPSAAAALDALSATGNIRFGFSSDPARTGYFAPARGSGPDATLPFFTWNFDVPITSIDQFGNVFTMGYLEGIAHELHHMAYGSKDPGPPGSAPTDADLNSITFDPTGPAVRFEQTVAQELNYDSYRLTYHSALTPPSASYVILTSQISWTGGRHVDLTRFGDQNFIDQANEIDYVDRPGDVSILVLGFGGNDVINGGAGTNFLYGNAGADTIYGGDGKDYIFGDAANKIYADADGVNDLQGFAGDDFIVAGPKGDLVRGDDGDDLIVGGEGDDLIYGGEGADLIFTGRGRNTVFGGEGDDRIVLTNPGEVGDWSSHTVIEAGGGADTIWITPDSHMHAQEYGFEYDPSIVYDSPSIYYITDSDPADRLIWHDYLLTGGIFTVMREHGS